MRELLIGGIAAVIAGAGAGAGAGAAQAQGSAEPLDAKSALVLALRPTLASPAVNRHARSRDFHPVEVDKLFYPGELPTGVSPWDAYDTHQNAYYDAQAVERWYVAQIPANFRATLWNEELMVLYLPACTGGSPYDVDLNLGDTSASEIPSTVYERAWVANALERLGITGIEVPEFGSRQNDAQRSVPDPSIKALNAKVAERATPKGILVLESYCGPRSQKLLLPGQVPPPEPDIIAQGYTQAPTRYYRLVTPRGFVSGAVAGLTFAEGCRFLKGNRLDTSCPEWTPVSSGAVLTGRGKYRLVATVNGTRRAYRYEVLPMHLSEEANAPPVAVSLEP